MLLPLPVRVEALEPAPPPLGADLHGDASAAQLIRFAIQRSVTRFGEHEVGLRLGDSRAVHQARVGIRRLRSDLHTLRPLIVDALATGVDDDLRWLAGHLGTVRDADIAVTRVRMLAPAIGVSGLRPLVNALRRRRKEVEADLRAAVGDPRYDHLVVAIDGLAGRMRLAPSAAGPALEVLPALVADRWRKLRKAVRAVAPEPADADLHHIRILAKRTRYAAELLEPISDQARQFAALAADLQGLLGLHQDAVTVRTMVMAVGPSLTAGAAFAAGEAAAMEASTAEAMRAAWPGAWSNLKRKQLRSWL
ncbi:MAG: CHAD domain-containing protein [Candidatus Dormibacteria bacterium]